MATHTQSPRLLDQVRDAIRLKHYSIRTEQAYIGWIKRFILFHGKRHPREMGAEEITMEFIPPGDVREPVPAYPSPPSRQLTKSACPI